MTFSRPNEHNPNNIIHAKKRKENTTKPDEHEHSCSDEDDTNDAADYNASNGSGGETN